MSKYPFIDQDCTDAESPSPSPNQKRPSVRLHECYTSYQFELDFWFLIKFDGLFP